MPIVSAVLAVTVTKLGNYDYSDVVKCHCAFPESIGRLLFQHIGLLLNSCHATGQQVNPHTQLVEIADIIRHLSEVGELGAKARLTAVVSSDSLGQVFPHQT